MLQILTSEIGERWIQPELFVVPNLPKTCADCNAFDSSIPAENPWKFCLRKGQYIPEQDLTICGNFTPIIPYQPPPKKRRGKGDGTGSIQLHYCKAKSGKSYEQFYYHYEIWENGVKQYKGSKYIPAKKLDLIREMEAEKQSVTLILRELGLVV